MQCTHLVDHVVLPACYERHKSHVPANKYGEGGGVEQGGWVQGVRYERQHNSIYLQRLIGWYYIVFSRDKLLNLYFSRRKCCTYSIIYFTIGSSVMYCTCTLLLLVLFKWYFDQRFLCWIYCSMTSVLTNREFKLWSVETSAIKWHVP